MSHCLRGSRPRRNSLGLTLGLTIAFGAIGFAPTSAQEAAVESGDTQGAAQSGQQTQKDAPAKKTSGTSSGSGEVFVPTEEISEDYAVSFPVDI